MRTQNKGGYEKTNGGRENAETKYINLEWRQKKIRFARMNPVPATVNYPSPAKHGYFQLDDNQQKALNAYEALLKLKNYSLNTLSVYRNWFILFLKSFPERKPSTISKTEIIDFLFRFRNSAKWSAASQNQLVNSIKFFYEKLLHRPEEAYDLPRAKKPEQLPSVLDESEVLAIIKATDNLKHKTILCLAYAGGLRVSEIVALQIKDVDSKRMVITLRQSKGKKDRIVMLSEKLLIMLRAYYKEYKPKQWMFEGQSGGQYSARSIQMMLAETKKKAGVSKKGSIHALRHSFATHLLEGGTDLLTIKQLLGHNSMRSTMIYTHISKKHISKIISPLDKL